MNRYFEAYELMNSFHIPKFLSLPLLAVLTLTPLSPSGVNISFLSHSVSVFSMRTPLPFSFPCKRL